MFIQKLVHHIVNLDSVPPITYKDPFPTLWIDHYT
jgi:hypothetical protein